MNGKDLMEGLSHLDEAYIAQAASADGKGSGGKKWYRYAAVAACLCLLCVGAWQIGELADGRKTGQLQVEYEGENVEKPADPGDAAPGICPGEQVKLVVDHWENGILYLRVPEQKGERIPAILQDGVSVPESVESGSLVTVTVADRDSEDGTLYVSKIEPAE